MVAIEQQLYRTADGLPLCTSYETVFVCGGGGLGGVNTSSNGLAPLPERTPDLVAEFRTSNQAGLIYRQSGDRNPLHWSPEVARSAGFERPILHDFCRYAIVGWQILDWFCDGDPQGLRSLALRFSAPVFPGETLRTSFWREQKVLRLCTHVVERDLLVLDRGLAEIAAPHCLS